MALARERMIADQIAARGIKDGRVLDAIRNVPRHEFVPDNLQGNAYTDRPLPIGNGQTISQPYIVALMTELAAVKAGDKVLEIGTGSGYQAAVLAKLTPHVYTIEIVEPLYNVAKARLKKYGLGDDHVRLGDGYKGIPEHAPYDAIVVTAAPKVIPQPLLDQLKPGGRLVIPVGAVDDIQHLRLVTKAEDGTISSRNIIPVRFVPMTGEAQKAR